MSNKMDTRFTGMWVNFFTAAGIPSDVAATYALTFTENRIQNDMLLDLNKEYLRDMGITRMGDVIAILRHAKQVHENAARERVLGGSGPAPAPAARLPVAAVTGRTTPAQPSSPASRILEHYTRNPPTPEPAAGKRKSSDRGDAPAPAEDLGIKKARLIRFGSPGHQASTKESTNSKTVFARLGSGDSMKIEKTQTVKAAVKPIYARLGSKQELQAQKVPQIPVPKDALKYEGILKSSVSEPVKKVFTVTTSKNNIRKIAMSAALCSMRADEAPVSVKDKLALPKTKSVKFSNHVEYKEIEVDRKPIVPPGLKARLVPQKMTQVFNKPERRLSMTEVASDSVKARLGTKNVKDFTITKSVFKRLGV